MRLFKKLFMDIYAAMTTVVTDNEGGGFYKFTDAVRAVYSKEIEFKAMPNMRFLQFASIKTELGVQPGLTINMLVYDNLTRGGSLTEGTKMVTKALSGSQKSITVTEHGNAVAVSELTLQSSFDDTLASATALLGRDYAIVLDLDLRDAAVSATNANYVYAKTSAGTKIDSRATLDATCTLKTSTIKDAVEILATNNAPKFPGGYYICFVHPHQSRALRDDPAWLEASKYGAPEQLFTGEIGRIDDVRFIETTLMPNGAAAETDAGYVAALKHGAVGAPADVDVFQAVVFGENYYGLAISLPVELRDNGVVDFGREHGVAWYSIYGVGKLHSEYGVILETA